MEDWTGRLAAWSEFALFHVLPIAIAQIYDWVREWQILVATILVLAFIHLWTRTVLRAARQAARDTVQSETRGLDAGIKLLRQKVEGGQEPPKPASAPSMPQQPLQTTPRAEEAQMDAKAAVEHLRQAIRLALGTIPLSDSPLPPDCARLYKAAISSLAGASVTADERQGVFGQILAEMQRLEREFPPQSCRQAWESLVKANRLAREFHEPPQTPTAVRLATP